MRSRTFSAVLSLLWRIKQAVVPISIVPTEKNVALSLKRKPIQTLGLQNAIAKKKNSFLQAALACFLSCTIAYRKNAKIK